MKTRINVICFIALAMLFVSSGCAVSTHYLQQGARKYPSVNPDEVRIYVSEEIPGNYLVLGSVAVDTGGDGEEAKKLLQKRAGSFGANAVIGVRLTKITSFSSRTGLSGTAIRMQPGKP